LLPSAPDISEIKHPQTCICQEKFSQFSGNNTPKTPMAKGLTHAHRGTAGRAWKTRPNQRSSVRPNVKYFSNKLKKFLQTADIDTLAL